MTTICSRLRARLTSLVGRLVH